MNNLIITSAGIHESNATKLPNSEGKVKYRIEFQNVEDAETHRIATKRFLKEGEKLGAIEKHFHVVLEVKDHNGNTKRAVVNTNSLRKRFELGDKICDKKGCVLPAAVTRIMAKLSPDLKLVEDTVDALLSGSNLPGATPKDENAKKIVHLCQELASIQSLQEHGSNIDDLFGDVEAEWTRLKTSSPEAMRPHLDRLESVLVKIRPLRDDAPPVFDLIASPQEANAVEVVTALQKDQPIPKKPTEGKQLQGLVRLCEAVSLLKQESKNGITIESLRTIVIKQFNEFESKSAAEGDKAAWLRPHIATIKAEIDKIQPNEKPPAKDDEIAKTAVQFLFTGKSLPKIPVDSFPLADVLQICEAASNMRVACYGPPPLDDEQRQKYHQEHVSSLIDQFRSQPEDAMKESSWAGPCIDAVEAFTLSMLPATDELEQQPLPNINQTDEDAALDAARALERGEDIPSADQLIGLPKLFIEVCQTLTLAKELCDPEQPEEQLTAYALASNALAQFEDLAKASGKQWAIECLEKAKALEPKTMEAPEPLESLQEAWTAASNGVNQYQVGGPAACTPLTIAFLSLKDAATSGNLKEIITRNDYKDQTAPFVDEAVSAAVEAKTFERATDAGFLAHQVPFSERDDQGHRNLVTQFMESDGDRAVISANDYTIGMRKFGDQIEIFDPHGKAETGNAAYVRRGNQDEIAQFLKDLYPVPVFGEHYSFLELYLLKAKD